MVVVVFDSALNVFILPSYGKYPLCKYSRPRNESLFGYDSLRDTPVLNRPRLLFQQPYGHEMCL